jgi:isoleucyl-tRNA synthetase
MLDTLLRMLAPLIPFTADEVYAHVPGKSAESVHLLTLHPADPRFTNVELEAEWQRLLVVRGEAMKLLEAMRQAGEIGAPLEARLELGPAPSDNAGISARLRDHRDQLKDLFIVSEVTLFGAEEAAHFKHLANGDEDFRADGYFGHVATQPPLVMVGRKAPGRKCQRCWKYFDDDSDSDLDPRCRAVVQAQA